MVSREAEFFDFVYVLISLSCSFIILIAMNFQGMILTVCSSAILRSLNWLVMQ